MKLESHTEEFLYLVHLPSIDPFMQKNGNAKFYT